MRPAWYSCPSTVKTPPTSLIWLCQAQIQGSTFATSSIEKSFSCCVIPTLRIELPLDYFLGHLLPQLSKERLFGLIRLFLLWVLHVNQLRSSPVPRSIKYPERDFSSSSPLLPVTHVGIKSFVQDLRGTGAHQVQISDNTGNFSFCSSLNPCNFGLE